MKQYDTSTQQRFITPNITQDASISKYESKNHLDEKIINKKNPKKENVAIPEKTDYSDDLDDIHIRIEDIIVDKDLFVV